MNHVSQNRSHGRGGKLRVAPAMTLGLALLLTGCENLLTVELPGTLVVEDLKNPALAEVLLNSAIASNECSYSRFTNRAAGMEEVYYDFDTNFPTQYQDVVNGSSNCGTTVIAIRWVNSSCSSNISSWSLSNRSAHTWWPVSASISWAVTRTRFPTFRTLPSMT